ncbi:MAG TPA: YggT family protein [Candidatus Binatia bacterium]|nr:YggT family protein [Candidatus Binatia bacterium]
MFVVANLIRAVALVLDYLLWAYMWIVIARAILSWVNPDPYNPIVRFLYNATEPVLYRIRRALPLFAGGIDFSPIIVFVIILFLQQFLVRSLYDLAQTIQYAG